MTRLAVDRDGAARRTRTKHPSESSGVVLKPVSKRSGPKVGPVVPGPAEVREKDRIASKTFNLPYPLQPSFMLFKR